MQNCKKYKATPNVAESHHNSPASNCESCVYFAKQNCGVHGNMPEVVL